MKKTLLIGIIITLLMLGCSDTGSGSGEDQNSSPVANAGSDQDVTTGDIVSLDGSQSSDADNDTLTYSWTNLSLPTNSSAELSDTNAVTPTFTADVEGVYSFELTVSDSKLTSTPDTITITATTPFNGVVLQNGRDGYTGCEDAILAINEQLYLGDEDTSENVIGNPTENYSTQQFLFTHFCPT